MRTPEEPDRGGAETDPFTAAGPYVFCDRWCEYCAARPRCVVFHEAEQPLIARGRTPEERDADRFADGLIDSMAELLGMRELEISHRDDTAPARSPSHPTGATLPPDPFRQTRALLRCEARAYWKASRAMLDEMPAAVGIFDSDLEELMRFKIGDPGMTRGAIAETLRVVQWYVPVIEIHLRRAATALAEEAAGQQGTTPRASDGHAKVVLLALDRSLPAWVQLREHFVGDFGDELLDLLLAGERLRRAVEERFPSARTFRRPELD